MIDAALQRIEMATSSPNMPQFTLPQLLDKDSSNRKKGIVLVRKRGNQSLDKITGGWSYQEGGQSEIVELSKLWWR